MENADLIAALVELGFDPITLLRWAIWLGALTVVGGFVKPLLVAALAAVRRKLDTGRIWARGTRVLWDDHLMAAATVVVEGLAGIGSAVFWVLAVLAECLPSFLDAMKRAREAKAPPPPYDTPEWKRALESRK